jgi:tetratricopeptide (TPR) repeat protein
LSAGALTTNQDYWLTPEHGSLKSLIASNQPGVEARRVAEYYSQALDYWGTELQKAGLRRKLPALVEQANGQFIEAVVLNPANFIARANQQINAAMRGGRRIGPPGAGSNAVTQWEGRWDQALRVCGPADEPQLDIQIGRFWAQRGAYRQAAGLFQRSLELAPGNLTAELDLANAYVDLGLADAAFTLIADVRKRFPSGDKLDLVGVDALASAAKNDFARADTLLTDAHRENPQDDRFTAQMAEIYRLIGFRVLKGAGAAPDNNARGAAVVWFKKALKAYNEHLQFLDSQPIRVQDGDAVSRRVAEMQKLITTN